VAPTRRFLPSHGRNGLVASWPHKHRQGESAGSLRDEVRQQV
jgi:hypothetical protein